jgi:hypothetical protein
MVCLRLFRVLFKDLLFSLLTFNEAYDARIFQQLINVLLDHALNTFSLII